jgi:hypothetical protein
MGVMWLLVVVVALSLWERVASEARRVRVFFSSGDQSTLTQTLSQRERGLSVAGYKPALLTPSP